MSTLIKNQDKNEILGMLAIICRAVLYKGITPEQQKAVEQHIMALARMPDLNCQVRFETKPELQQTIINLVISPVLSEHVRPKQ